jgi:hypothetical protein
MPVGHSGCHLYECNAVRFRILDGARLKAGNGKQHSLVCSQRLDLVLKHLNVLAFDLASVMFAFDQDDKLCTERRERGNNVNDVLTVCSVQRSEVF